MASLLFSVGKTFKYVCDAISSSMSARLAAPPTSLTLANSASTTGLSLALGSVTASPPAPVMTLFHASRCSWWWPMAVFTNSPTAGGTGPSLFAPAASPAALYVATARTSRPAATLATSTSPPPSPPPSAAVVVVASLPAPDSTAGSSSLPQAAATAPTPTAAAPTRKPRRDRDTPPTL